MSRRKNTAEAYEILHRIYRKRKEAQGEGAASPSSSEGSPVVPERSSGLPVRDGSAAPRGSRLRRTEPEPLLGASKSLPSKGWLGRGWSRLVGGRARGGLRGADTGSEPRDPSRRDRGGEGRSGGTRESRRVPATEAFGAADRRGAQHGDIPRGVAPSSPPPQRWLSSGLEGPWRPSDGSVSPGVAPAGDEPLPRGGERPRGSDVLDGRAFDGRAGDRVSLREAVWDLDEASRRETAGRDAAGRRAGRAPWLDDEERRALLRDPPYRVPGASSAHVPVSVAAEGTSAERSEATPPGAAGWGPPGRAERGEDEFPDDPGVGAMNGLDARYPSSRRASEPSSNPSAVASQGGTSPGRAQARSEATPPPRGGGVSASPRVSERRPVDRDGAEGSREDSAERPSPRRGRGPRRRRGAVQPARSEAARSEVARSETVRSEVSRSEAAGTERAVPVSGGPATPPEAAPAPPSRRHDPLERPVHVSGEGSGEDGSWVARLRGWLLGTTGSTLLERKLEVRLSTLVGFALAAVLLGVLVLMEAGAPGRRGGYSLGIPVEDLPGTDVAADPGVASESPYEGYQGGELPAEVPGEGLEPEGAADDGGGAPLDPEAGSAPVGSDRAGGSPLRAQPIWGTDAALWAGDAASRRQGGIGRHHDPDLRDVRQVPDGTVAGREAGADGARPEDPAGDGAARRGDAGGVAAGEGAAGGGAPGDSEPTSYWVIQARAHMFQQNADAFVGHLRGLGFTDAFAAPQGRTQEGVRLYFVFAGKYLSKSEADSRNAEFRRAIERRRYPGGRDFGLDSYVRERTLP